MSEIGPGELNRATLQRQLLLERHDLSVPTTVERIMAVQAQEPAAPYVALWNRIRDLDFTSVDDAFTERSVLKASLMRITLHAVTAADHPAFQRACRPILRAARLNDRRFLDTGLTAADADAVVGELLGHLAEPRSKDDILDYLAATGHGSSEPRLWWALRTFAPLIHVPAGPPWSYPQRPSYEAAPAAEHPDLETSVERLVRRYLAAFGPASIGDLVQFTMLKTPVVRAAVTRIGDHLVTVRGPGGTELLDVIDSAPIPAASTEAPLRLMAMWDSILLAYRDRSRVMPDAVRPHVIRRNGDVLPTVLVDGTVAGVWRIADDGIEVSAFRPFTTDDHDQLGREAQALIAAIGDRRPLPFQRYDSWWAKLPTDDRRIRVALG